MDLGLFFSTSIGTHIQTDYRHTHSNATLLIRKLCMHSETNEKKKHKKREGMKNYQPSLERFLVLLLAF